ncbi:MAG: histidinol-phosphate transaminase [Gammaproteobacteria bacterium]
MSDQEQRIRSVITPNVLEMEAYSVQEASGMIKLDAMENPYPFPAELTEAWLETIRALELNRYPDPAAKGLAATLRRTYDIADSLDLIFGNGSDELIQIILMAVAVPGATVLAPEPTFVMYRQIARSLGLEFVGIPLCSADFALDLEAMQAAIRRHRPSVVFLSYPNNPTGNLFDEAQIEAIVSSAPGLVVIDEAYAPFAGRTFLQRLRDHPDLLLLRTVSKLGLAGCRLGFLLGNPGWVRQFDKIRLPYNINVLTQVTVEFALSHYSHYEKQSECIVTERGRLFDELHAIPGLTPFPSRANFILFRVEDRDAGELYQDLKKAGILIKNLSRSHELIHGCLRVTVGNPTENQRFLGELRRILAD